MKSSRPQGRLPDALRHGTAVVLGAPGVLAVPREDVICPGCAAHKALFLITQAPMGAVAYRCLACVAEADGEERR